MNNKFRNTYIYIFLSLFSVSLSSSANVYKDKIFAPSIKTLQVFQSSDPLSYPSIELNSGESITVSFDDIRNEDKPYQYKLVHCNADHQRSDLMPSEYVRGMQRAYIDDYDFSFNTNINYVHYAITIPNETMQITKSGVYALTVYEEDELQPILHACFYVYESLVNITTNVHYNSEKGIRNHYQQVDIEIDHPGYNIYNPSEDTKLLIKQNNRLDNMVSDVKPSFTQPGKLLYSKNAKLTFEGGNEYYYLDATTSKYAAHGVDHIDYQRPYEHFVLQPYQASISKSYSARKDINGKLVVRKQEADQDALDLESDYIFVHFFVPKERPEFTGRLYLSGRLSYDDISPSYELEYNIAEKRYETSVLLKQGRIEYRYLFVKKNTSCGTSEPFDADFCETENDYQLYFFHRAPSDRYDRLIAYSYFNSQNSNE